MCSLALLALQLALLVIAAGADDDLAEISISKCCDFEEMLSADGMFCVRAIWRRNVSHHSIRNGIVYPPLDNEWMRHWLPPGLNVNVTLVRLNSFHDNYIVSSVNESSVWNYTSSRNEDLNNNTITYLGTRDFIARSTPKGGLRRAFYCVDAAQQPLGPFAMRFKTICSGDECVRKCCVEEEVLKNEGGDWKCEKDPRGHWSPYNSSLRKIFDPEFPAAKGFFCTTPRLAAPEDLYADWAHTGKGTRQLRFSTWDTCYDFHRSPNGSLSEALFYCEVSRITRGVYWILRPLCIVSALLLGMSLLSIACDRNMRRKIHGHCLASHAACLFAFNFGQIAYYFAISDELDENGKHEMPPELESVCKYFALSMYFLLTAAWFWLTALCVNMTFGFRIQVNRPKKESRKRFLVLSALAWGIPVLLTIACSCLFTQPNLLESPPWYAPSLMETRVCFMEPTTAWEDTEYALEDFVYEEYSLIKSGTALFYYGPVCCLVFCNIICLAKTLKKVQYLRKGNSVLRREEDQIPLGQRHAEGNNPPSAHTATGDGNSRGGRNKRGGSTTIDVKTIKLYIKMVLMTGGIELLSEVIMWCLTGYKENEKYESKDHDLPYRASGYVTDFFRAVVVTWMAAPEGGYLGPILRRLRKEKKQNQSTRVGNGGRRKQNVA